jgi:hypothetical protein
MVGSMDHIAIFKNPSKLEYSLSADLNQNMKMRVNCFGDKVVLRSETAIEDSSE